MKYKYISFALGCVLLSGILSSCHKELHPTPSTGTSALTVYSTPAGYKEVLAKAYGAFALTGNNGAGSGDIAGIDAGTSDFLRLFWNLQELPTDEAICAWGDPGVPDLHNMNWTSGNVIIAGLYYRSLYQITVCNEFIRQSADANISKFASEDQNNIRVYRAEARFLRAYQYWVLMDLFANPPFVTENDPVGAFQPPQKSRADVFTYVEAELKAIDPLLLAPRANEYGRADQATAWALLARMYLNAEVYTGTAHYADASTYAAKVIAAGYSLKPKYQDLFLADNNLNNPEVILSINYDGTNTQNYGGTTFLVNSSIGGSVSAASEGVPNGGWSGNRSTKNLVNLFPQYSGGSDSDKRGMFGNTKEDIDVVSTFTDGLAVLKYKNITSTGSNGVSTNGTFVSTDFPLFRLAEMYLIYAEAAVKGGGGNTGTALGYINQLRARAYGSTSKGMVTSITTDFILDERARELYWECFRRSDLIRYGKFTGSNYLWPWKGGVKAGSGVSDVYKIFPIPTNDLSANNNLIQNPGY